MEQVRYVTIDDYLFAPGQTLEAEAHVNRITKDTYYALVVSRELTGVDEGKSLRFATADTLMRFKVCAPTLDSLYVKDGVMALTGDWDPIRFGELATDTSLVGYDLTQVKGINSQPVAANPNALFYVATPLDGCNIVYQDRIAELCLTQGYNFSPLGTYTATNVVFTPQWRAGQWNSIALPFTALVPDGYICRRPTTIASTTWREAVLTDTLCAGTPYLMMTDSETPAPITAENVTIDMNAISVGIAGYVPVLTDRVAGDSVLVLNLDMAEDLQYFEEVDPSTRLRAFTGVVKGKRRVRATLNATSDQAYKILATAISAAMLAYEEWHPAIEAEWNVMLLDSIASVRTIYAAMSMTSANKIKEVATDLLAFVDKYKLRLIDKSEPIEYTGYIVNPSFETGKKDGWTAGSNVAIRTRTYLATFGAGMDGKYLLYNESTDGSTAISQTIEGLPRGYYRLSAMLGTNEDGVVTLFANDSTATFGAHEWGRFYLTESVLDSVWVEDGVLTIGVEAEPPGIRPMTSGSTIWVQVPMIQVSSFRK